MPRKSALRFSIRSILILTTCVAVVVWWLVAPSRTANRFVNLVNAERHEEAAAMFVVDGANAMLTEWKPLVDANAIPIKLTAADLWQGRRAIHLSVTYENSVADKPGFFPLEANFRGIFAINNIDAREAARFNFSVGGKSATPKP